MKYAFISSTLFVTLSFGIAACDASKDDGGGQPASASEGASATPAKGDTEEASAKAAAVEMVEHDLSSAHADWKGWVAKGPKDAKVLADGVNGARIAGKGPSILDRKPGGDSGFDLAFEPGKQDLKSLKTNLEKGAANSAADTKLTLAFTKDEPTMLEWTAEVAGTKTYNFVKHIEVEGKSFTCKNNYMMGSGNDAEHKRVLEACGSLRKK